MSLAALTGESWADTPPGWGLRLLVDRAFEDAGLLRTIRFEVDDIASIVEFVRAGVAIALLTESMIDQVPLVEQSRSPNRSSVSRHSSSSPWCGGCQRLPEL